MSLTGAPPFIRHVEDWRAMITLNAYRGFIGFGLVALLLFGKAASLFGVALPQVFRLACLIYLVVWALAVVAARRRRPPLHVQIVLACAADVVFFTSLMLASTGVAGGLGMLLIAPLSATGMLLPGRLAALLAACAAIGVLGQEALRPFQVAVAQTESVQAGILGILYFLVVAVSHWLARRARISEALAVERAGEVRDLAALNRRIIQQMEIGAIVVDADQRICLINDAALRLLDLTERAPQDEMLAKVNLELQRAMSRWLEAPHGTVSVIHSANHALLPLFSRLGADTQAPVLIFLEDALRQSEQAQQLKLISLGRLTSSIAHEIRNPLGAISHAGELLRESETLGPEDRRLLDIVHRHTRRIDQIITSVLGLSRRSQLARQPLVLADWLHETVDDYCEYNQNAPRFVVDDIDPRLYVEFDPGHLRQVLCNLWDNAQRYARRADVDLEIRLSARCGRNGLFFLDISDNGPGLAQEIADQVMEPFFTTAREGTGLGLHIACELCEANRARLTPVAQSAGACFRIVFAHAWSGAEQPARSPLVKQSS